MVARPRPDMTRTAIGLAAAALFLWADRLGADQGDTQTEGIEIGGAVRFQYRYEDYNATTPSSRRGGDLSFDTFALAFDGRKSDLILSAEYRFYSYMDVVHHAWFGYDLSPRDRLHLGVTPVPFGIVPFSSHSYFFSSNYYLGLEDDYDFGLLWRHRTAQLSIDAGLYKNDELGGMAGADNSGRDERYSFDIVGARAAGEDSFAAPSTELEENNTALLRAAYAFIPSERLRLQVGLSAQGGEITDAQGRQAGRRRAYALHGVLDSGPWNLQVQVTDYEFDLDSDAERIAVAAFASFDTIANEARTYALNLAYAWPVSLGPVSELLFYNDHSRVVDKSAGLSDTVMNVTGVAMTAGDVIAYLDIVRARNQPFVGGTMDSTEGDWNTRINLHLGWYF